MMRDRQHEGPEAAALTPTPARPHRAPASPGNAALARAAEAVASAIGPGGVVDRDVASAIDARRGAGIALDQATRERVAPIVGDPLADVRVHHDTQADHLSRAVEARAFTTGTDVFFRAGEHRPGTADGDRLLTHELTHVAQQRGAPTSGPMVVTAPGDAVETEAEAISAGP